MVPSSRITHRHSQPGGNSCAVSDRWASGRKRAEGAWTAVTTVMRRGGTAALTTFPGAGVTSGSVRYGGAGPRRGGGRGPEGDTKGPDRWRRGMHQRSGCGQG
ncbi:hypothetical protein GCM10020256_34180 [Streptomyces thermocoprophilus]